ncbi:MAG: HEAT repeat domain-containing protein [Gemmataceae bacterium]
MDWRQLILVPLATICLAGPTEAGIFSRRAKANPADQVPEIIRVLHSDTDEHHRVAAAEELGRLDAKTYPNIQPVLIEALMKDPSANVRHEAAQSLGKIRPLSSQTAYALEQSLANDSSTRVRVTARTALWQYHLAGYRNGNNPPTPPQTAEPPLAGPAPTARNRTAPATRPGVRETTEPPLATNQPPVSRTSPAPRTLPTERMPAARIIPPTEPPMVLNPPPRPIVPAAEPKIDLPTPPAAPPKPTTPPKKDDDGPVLNPPG